MNLFQMEKLLMGLFVLAILFMLYQGIAAPLLDRLYHRKAPKVRAEAMSELQLQGVLYGTFISALNRDAFASLDSRIDYAGYRKVLKRQWAVTNHDSAIEALDNLACMTHSRHFDQMLQLNFSAYEKTIKKTVGLLDLASCPYELPEEFTVYGWDVVRLSALAKWCFWLGYISEQELNGYFAVCIQLCNERGRDWDEFAYSYLLGRTMHGFKPRNLPKMMKMCLPNLKKYPFKETEKTV